MRVGILGAGGMGSLFGGLLAGAGHEVWFVDQYEAHVDAIERHGLRLSYMGEERLVRGHATTDAAEAGPVDLAMLWCKSQDTADALRSGAALFGPRTIGFTAQNGLGNAEQLEAVVGPDRLVYGSAAIGATVLAPGHIELTEGAWTGTGKTWLGTRRSEAAAGRLAAVADALREAGVTVELPADIDAVLWNKLSSVAAGAVAAIARLRLPVVAASPPALEVIAAMTREVAAVAAAKGIALDADEALARNLEIYAGATNPSFLPSIVVDVLERRPTEIGASCELIAREGERLGVPAPVNATLAALVRTIEQNYDDVLLGDARSVIADGIRRAS